MKVNGEVKESTRACMVQEEGGERIAHQGVLQSLSVGDECRNKPRRALTSFRIDLNLEKIEIVWFAFLGIREGTRKSGLPCTAL